MKGLQNNVNFIDHRRAPVCRHNTCCNWKINAETTQKKVGGGVYQPSTGRERRQQRQRPARLSAASFAACVRQKRGALKPRHPALLLWIESSPPSPPQPHLPSLYPLSPPSPLPCRYPEDGGDEGLDESKKKAWRKVNTSYTNSYEARVVVGRIGTDGAC